MSTILVLSLPLTLWADGEVVTFGEDFLEEEEEEETEEEREEREQQEQEDRDATYDFLEGNLGKQVNVCNLEEKIEGTLDVGQMDACCAESKLYKKAEDAGIASIPVWSLALAGCGLMCYYSVISIGITEEALGWVCSMNILMSTALDLPIAGLIAKDLRAIAPGLAAGAVGGASAAGAFGIGACTGLALATAVVGFKAYQISSNNSNKHKTLKQCRQMFIDSAGYFFINESIERESGHLDQIKKDRLNKTQTGAEGPLGPGLQEFDSCLADHGTNFFEYPEPLGPRGPKTIPSDVGAWIDLGSQSCNSKRKSGDFNGALSCAKEAGARLPGGLNEPQVREIFKKASGQSIESFVQSVPDNVTLAQLMAQSIGGGGLLKKSPRELLPHFQKFESKLMSRIENGELDELFAKMGHTFPSKSVGHPANTTSSIWSKASKVLGLDSESQTEEKTASVDQAPKKHPGLRTPAMSVEVSQEGIITTKGASLFERVSERYRQNKDKVRRMPWSLKTNRATLRGR